MSNTTVREEYTPTMDEIKGWYAGAVDEYRCDTGMSADEAEAAFDRAIAVHDRALREQFAREMLSDDALGRGYVRLMATRRGEHPVATFSAAVQKVVSNAAQIARVESE